MNKLLGFMLLSWCFSACIQHHRSEAQAVSLFSSSGSRQPRITGDTLNADIKNFLIHWTATEMHGLRKRTGKISFKKGVLLIKEGQLTGGEFTVDMCTMGITDIAAHEKIARRNLLNHLQSADFFDTKTYPDATFKITEVENFTVDSMQLSGELTIKGITKKGIRFTAFQAGNHIATTFKFNRMDWDITFQGNWIDKTFIDDDIELRIEIYDYSS